MVSLKKTTPQRYTNTSRRSPSATRRSRKPSLAVRPSANVDSGKQVATEAPELAPFGRAFYGYGVPFGIPA